MTTEISTRKIPAPTPRHAQSLSPEALAEYRRRIASEMEIFLDGYWDKQPPPQIKAGILADWADSLDDWSLEQIVYALRKWRDDNPSKRPNPGHIKGLLLSLRGHAEAKRIPQPEPEPNVKRISDKRRAEIMAEVFPALAAFKRMDS